MLFTYSQCKEKYGSQYQLNKAIKNAELYQLEKGVYSDKKRESDICVISFKYPCAVLTLNSAFYYYGLTDTIPEKYILSTERGAAKITDGRVIQKFENSGTVQLGAVDVEYQDNILHIYDRERLLLELLRNKTKLPFDYYKEVLSNFRKIIEELNMQDIQDYAYELPKSAMIMELLQLEVL